MTDVLTPAQRYRNMKAIKSRNTKPEVYIRKLLFSQGYRYRLHRKNLPGTPDLWLRKYNTAIFVHGCFWHVHGCSMSHVPCTNRDFWEKKFAANMARDARVSAELSRMGIRRLVIWECTVRKIMKDGDLRAEFLERIRVFLHGNKQDSEL